MLCELVSPQRICSILHLAYLTFRAPLHRYFSSRETHRMAENPEESLELIKTSFEGDYEIGHLDGIIEANSGVQLLKVGNLVLALIG